MTKRRLAPLLLAAAVLLGGRAAEGASLTGTVVRKEDGQPVRGASLWAAPGIVNTRTPPSAITGPDGSFEIPDPPDGPFALYACAGGHLPWALILGSAAAQTGPLAVALEPAAELRGRVLDAEGRPVSGASVQGELDEDWQRDWLSSSPPSWMKLHPCAPPERASTDSEGRFTLAPLQPGRYALRAQLPGQQKEGGIREVEASPGAVVDGLEIRVRRTGLTFRVINDLDARPVPAAQVSVVAETWALHVYESPREEALWRAATAADGTARLLDLSAGTLWVEIARDGFAPAIRQEELAFGEQREIGVRLQPGGALTGRVLDETGRPVADAEVEVRWDACGDCSDSPPTSLEDRARRQTRTDARGTFGVRDLPAGEVELSILHPSFLPLQASATVLEGQKGKAGPLVLRRGATLAGTVTDPDGRPLAGVQLPGATTGPDGAFVLTRLEPGQLQAEAEGYVTERRTLCRFDAPLSLTLWPRDSGRIPGPDGKPVEGAGFHVGTAACSRQEDRRDLLVRAVDPGGAPLDQAEIRAEWETADPDRFRVHPSLHLSDGWFYFPSMPVEPVWIRIEASDHESLREKIEIGAGDVQVVAVLPRKDLKECDPPQPPEPSVESTVFAIATTAAEPVRPLRGVKIEIGTSWLRGRVLDPDGHPAAGATVRSRPAVRDPWAVLYTQPWIEIPEATTDAEGRFVLGPLGSDRIVAVAHAGVWTGRSDPVRLDQGRTVEVEVRLERRAALSGRVLDQAGQPVEGVSVTVAREKATSAADGSFRLIGLPPGTTRVSAYATPYEELVRDVEIGDGETRVDLVLAPNQSCGCVPVLARGRVTGPDGAPVAGAEISVRNGVEARSAADGSFAIRLPMLEAEEVIVRKPGLAVGSVLVEGVPTDGLEIRLEPDASITGRVHGLVGGEPEPDDVVWLDSKTGPFLSTSIQPDGTFEARQVPPGTWELEARISGRKARAVVELPPGRKEARADLVLPPVRPVSGRVVDELGRPIGGASLVVWWEDHSGSMASGAADADGSFSFLLPDGEYSVAIDKDGFQDGEIPTLQVQEGPVAGLEIRLERDTVLHGHLLGLPPSEKLSVMIKPLRPGRSRGLNGRITLDRYSIPGLGPGVWTIEAETRSCRIRKTFEIPAGATEMELDLDMTPTEAEP